MSFAVFDKRATSNKIGRKYCWSLLIEFSITSRVQRNPERVSVTGSHYNTQCNLHNKSIAHYKYLSDINIYQCQYIADIRYQCSAVLGCRDRVGGDRDCVGSGPGPCRVGSGTVPGGRGVEGWCGGTGRHSGSSVQYSVGMARHRHGKARHRHGGSTGTGVPRTFQNTLEKAGNNVGIYLLVASHGAWIDCQKLT